MARFKQFKQYKQNSTNDNNHRWLVSYADYMTLMFAFFVVMYAMATVQNKEFAAFSDTISNVFNGHVIKTEHPTSTNPAPILLSENEPYHTTNTPSAIGSDIVSNSQTINSKAIDTPIPLSDVSVNQQGQPLEAIHQALKKVLFSEIEQGYAVIQQDMDWLTIELSSSLMFISGSAVPTDRARNVLQTLIPILNTNRNFIRVRGYTDDLPINNEMFRSNWHLSVARSTEVLILLESLGITSARMASEGYGQYAPFIENSDELSRQQNRKVVIAISKYALPKDTIKKAKVQQQKELEKSQKSQEQRGNEIKVIELENGGIRITTREQQ